MLSEYLEAKLSPELLAGIDDYAKPYFRRMASFFAHADKFLRLLYSCNVWLSPIQSQTLIHHGHGFLEDFRSLAGFAYHDLELTRWKIQPKFHMAAEVLYQLQQDVAAGRDSINPLAHACQVDEDWIGQVATISRHVSSVTVHIRTIRRYLLALGSKW